MCVFVGKGTTEWFADRLAHEVGVYARLRGIQWKCVLVFLGVMGQQEEFHVVSKGGLGNAATIVGEAGGPALW